MSFDAYLKIGDRTAAGGVATHTFHIVSVHSSYRREYNSCVPTSIPALGYIDLVVNVPAIDNQFLQTWYSEGISQKCWIEEILIEAVDSTEHKVTRYAEFTDVYCIQFSEYYDVNVRSERRISMRIVPGSYELSYSPESSRHIGKVMFYRGGTSYANVLTSVRRYDFTLQRDCDRLGSPYGCSGNGLLTVVLRVGTTYSLNNIYADIRENSPAKYFVVSDPKYDLYITGTPTPADSSKVSECSGAIAAEGYVVELDESYNSDTARTNYADDKQLTITIKILTTSMKFSLK